MPSKRAASKLKHARNPIARGLLTDEEEVDCKRNDKLTCTQCVPPRTFKGSGEFGRHQRTIHDPEPIKHYCTWKGCGKSFTQASGLNTHMNIHNGLKPFQCAYCPSRFADPSSHNRHQKERHQFCHPYWCPLCNFRKKRKSEFRKHLETQHGLDTASIRIDDYYGEHKKVHHPEAIVQLNCARSGDGFVEDVELKMRKPIPRRKPGPAASSSRPPVVITQQGTNIARSNSSHQQPLSLSSPTFVPNVSTVRLPGNKWSRGSEIDHWRSTSGSSYGAAEYLSQPVTISFSDEYGINPALMTEPTDYKSTLHPSDLMFPTPSRLVPGLFDSSPYSIQSRPGSSSSPLSSYVGPYYTTHDSQDIKPILSSPMGTTPNLSQHSRRSPTPLHDAHSWSQFSSLSQPVFDSYGASTSTSTFQTFDSSVPGAQGYRS